MLASSAASPLDNLASVCDEWKFGPGKKLSIVFSSSAIISVAASSLLVWILFRSRHGINITYHRLLLGLSISDILLSLSWTTFGAVVPTELNYVVWNARGSRASCDAFGFIQTFGLYSGLLYMCSLNLYYLAKVKFNKTDTYIAKKLEPWLHFVPSLVGSIVSVVLLAAQRMNAAIDGVCSTVYNYEPPHCDGYEDGDTPEGFEIPCGRGRSAEPILYGTGLITAFLAPVTIGGSLWMIYQSVSRAEQRSSLYGVGALQIANDIRRRRSERDAATTDVEGGDDGGGGAFSIMSSVSSRFGGGASRTNSDNQDSSQSRAVLQKAAAYSLAYFVTWIWALIFGFLTLAGIWPTEFPPPTWQIAYRYVWSFFQALQGLWTFIIYIQPNVIKKKRSSEGNISWFRAFADALWSAVTGHTNSPMSRWNQPGPGALRTATAPGPTRTIPTPPLGLEGKNSSRQGNRSREEAMSLKAKDPEEEKREVLEDDPSV